LCDPAFHAAIIWPERMPPQQSSILVAGCGTSQAAILAYTNPAAKIVGIDFSVASLEHTAKLKAKHNLGNLELQQMDLHDVASLQHKFDLVYATGVLHHLSDPQKGLEALAQVSADDGVLCVMLYAKYGRTGVAMVQDALRALQADQTPSGILLARTILDSLPPQHAAQAYMRGARHDLDYDACLVDTFLHKQERSYTVPEILELTAACGLNFQGWTDNLDYYPDGALDFKHPVYQAITSLPENKQWAVTELLYQNAACHSFLLRTSGGNAHPINFNDASYQEWIPSRRYLLEVVEEKNTTILKRSRHTCRISGVERDLFHAVDGLASCGVLMAPFAKDAGQAEKVRRFFQFMGRLGHLTFTRYSQKPANL
jgi:SAM-dependent methyltransferase